MPWHTLYTHFTRFDWHLVIWINLFLMIPACQYFHHPFHQVLLCGVGYLLPSLADCALAVDESLYWLPFTLSAANHLASYCWVVYL